MTILNKTLIASAAVLAIGMGVQCHRLLDQQAQSDFLASQSAALKIQIEQSRQQRDQTLATLAGIQADLESVRHQTHPATGNTELDLWVARVDRLKQWLRAAPEKRIPEMQYLTTNDWFSVTVDNPLDTDARIRTALSKLRAMAKAKISQNIINGLKNYAKANPGDIPTDPLQLQPYVNPPLSDDILQRYEIAPEVPGKNDANGAFRDRFRTENNARIVLQEKFPVDADYDTWSAFTEKGVWMVIPISGELDTMVSTAMEAYSKANPGHKVTSPEQLLPYLPTSVDQTKLKEYWDVRPDSL